MKLQNLQIIGFFSLPSRSLQEANPEAYALAMRGIPWDQGAGQCAHCGMAITHHVVVRDSSDGKKKFIGTSCAERVGLDPEQIRYRRTPEEQAERDAKHAARVAENNAAEAKWKAEEAARRVEFADIIAILEAEKSEFYTSLANQLAQGNLSERQSNWVVKAVIGRRTKKTDDACHELQVRVCGWK
jgi:hypothetical protein